MLGVIYTTNAFLPLLKAGTTKKVISISTPGADLDLIVATEGTQDAAYCVSKAALNMVVAKYAAQYKKDGFTFLALSPGLVQTDALKGASDTRKKFVVGLHQADTLTATLRLFSDRQGHRMVADYPSAVSRSESGLYWTRDTRGVC